MTIKGFENWKLVDCRTAPDGCRMVAYEKGDYMISAMDAEYMPGGLRIDVSTLRKSRYTLDVYVDNNFGNSVQSVRIQTTAWGAMDAAEIDKVVEAYQAAQVLAQEIKNAFPQCFEIA